MMKQGCCDSRPRRKRDLACAGKADPRAVRGSLPRNVNTLKGSPHGVRCDARAGRGTTLILRRSSALSSLSLTRLFSSDSDSGASSFLHSLLWIDSPVFVSSSIMMFTSLVTAAAAFAAVQAAPISLAVVESSLSVPNSTYTDVSVINYRMTGKTGACGWSTEAADLSVGLPSELYADLGAVSSYCGLYAVVTDPRTNLSATALVADGSNKNETLSVSDATWNALNGTDSELSTSPASPLPSQLPSFLTAFFCLDQQRPSPGASLTRPRPPPPRPLARTRRRSPRRRRRRPPRLLPRRPPLRLRPRPPRLRPRLRPLLRPRRRPLRSSRPPRPGRVSTCRTFRSPDLLILTLFFSLQLLPRRPRPRPPLPRSTLRRLPPLRSGSLPPPLRLPPPRPFRTLRRDPTPAR
jgi:hypothetical protein